MAKQKADRYLKYHILWIVWAIIIAILMLLPSDSFPEAKVFSYDKLAHIGVFGLLSFLIARSFSRQKYFDITTTKNTLWTLTISIVYSSSLETLQQFIPGRTTDLYDFAANTIGAIAGMIVFITFKKISLLIVN